MELYATMKNNPTRHEAPPFVRTIPIAKGSAEYEKVVLDNLSFAYVKDHGAIGRRLKADELVIRSNRELFRETMIEGSESEEKDDWEEMVKARLKVKPRTNQDDLEMWIWTWTEGARRKVDKRLFRHVLGPQRVYWDLETSKWERISDSRNFTTVEGGVYHGRLMTVDGITFPVFHHFEASEVSDSAQSDAMFFFGNREDMPSVKTVEGMATFDSVDGGDISALVQGDEEYDAFCRVVEWGRARGDRYGRYWREPNGETTFPDFLVELNGEPALLEVTRIMVEMGPRQTYGEEQDDFPDGAGNLREIIKSRVAKKADMLNKSDSNGAPYYLVLIDVFGLLEPYFEIWKETRLNEFDRSFLVSPRRNEVFELQT